MITTNPMQGFDVVHQLWRLRHGKRMPDGEAESIFRMLAENVQSYEQVCEVGTPPYNILFGVLISIVVALIATASS